MRVLAFSIALFGLGVPALGADYSAQIERSIENYIRPAMVQFAAVSAALPEKVDTVCAEATTEAKAQFSAQFSKVVRSFGAINFLRFGPLVDDDRLSRLAFLPDPRGIAQRQIRKIYAKADAGVSSSQSLKGKSVALQGLTALQLIAFDGNTHVVLGDADKAREFTCAYAKAIAGNVAMIAAELSVAWHDPRGYSARLLKPDAGNDRIRTPKEGVETIFNALVTGLIVVKDQDILPALGKGPGKAKPNRVPFSRSANGLDYLNSELGGIRRALAVAKYGLDLNEEFAWLPGSLDYEFENAQKLLSGMRSPVRQTLKTQPVYGQMSVLVITLDSLRDTMALELAGALGLSGGFNALDGD